MTPTVANSAFVVPGSNKNLLISLDYTSNTQYTDVILNFSQPVLNAFFRVGDIDKLTLDTYYYLDKVTVTGTNAVGTVQPLITKYDAVTDPNFLKISGNTAYANPTSGFGGNTASDATDQKGTINVNFYGQWVNSITIRYTNYAGTQADPIVQQIVIGNIGFNVFPPLPLHLLDFDAVQNSNGSATLNWLAENESGLDHYSIGHSEDGVNFSEAGIIESRNDGKKNHYHFNDPVWGTGISYYRLKMVDIGGQITYSKIISLVRKESSEITVYPTVCNSEVNIQVKAANSGVLYYSLSDMSGRKLLREQKMLSTGQNHFKMMLPSGLTPGQYVVNLENYGTSRKIIIRN
jgi:hypothetical protein